MTDAYVRSSLPRYGRTPRGLLRDPHVPARAKVLYALLDDYAGADGRAFPARATLAEALGCSVSAVARELRALEAGGWVIREPRYREDGAQTSTLFVLTAGPVENHHPPVSPVTPPRVTGDTGPVSPVTHHEGEPRKENPPTPPEGGKRARREAQDGDPAWESFWSAYPRKTGKGAARRAWPPALDKVRGDHQLLVDAARAYARTITEVRYAAHPATWLRGERWTDDLGSLQQRGVVEDPTRPTAWRKGLPECPHHSGQHLDRCPACASERLAGDR